MPAVGRFRDSSRPPDSQSLSRPVADLERRHPGNVGGCTGAVLGAVRVTGKSLKQQQIVMLGAGSAGIGVADGLRAAMREEGLTEQEAQSRFWVIDKDGLLHSGRKELTLEQAVYARPQNEIAGSGLERPTDKSVLPT